MLGEAVLGHCSSAEKIDLSRFWNWQDSPADEATAITGVSLRPSAVAGLAAPNALGGVAPIINNVSAGDGGGGGEGASALAQALAAGGAAAQDFSATAFLGQDVLKARRQDDPERRDRPGGRARQGDAACLGGDEGGDGRLQDALRRREGRERPRRARPRPRSKRLQ